MPARLTLHPLERGGLREVRILANGSLSIGRGSDNDWVLPDPERHLSKTHCAVSMENGRLVLTDLSTNGLYVNGSTQPTIRNSRTVLATGDEFRLGDYRIAVDEAVGDGALDPLPGPASPPRAAEDPFAVRGSDPLDDLLGGPVTPGGRNTFQHPVPPAAPSGRGEDPFDMLEEEDQRSPRPQARNEPHRRADAFPGGPDDDLFKGSTPANPWRGAAQRDDVEAPQAAFQAPKPVVPMSLDELDALLGDADPGIDPPATVPQESPLAVFSPVADPAAYPEPPRAFVESGSAPAAFVDDIPTITSPALLDVDATHPRPADAAIEPSADPWGEPESGEETRSADAQPSAAAAGTDPRGSGSAAGLTAFLEGAGLRELPNGKEPDEVLRAAGAVFRDMVEGLREVLMSRAAIKNEFRLEQTMLRARDNNALKFSVTVEEALLALLVPDRAGYMKPPEAVRGAFSDIRSHEMAVMAGVQTALLGLLRRFDPPTLEARLQPNMLGQLLPGSRKARNWELFCTTYAEIAREAEDDFQTVFGREFARAYGAHARKT